MEARSWDAMYRGRTRVFSGEPNGVLVAETAGLAPGQALDVGCGEGADALWLARRGWQVTAVDISPVALRRAAATAAATDVAERVAWARCDLAEVPPPRAAFDLVSAHYFPLVRRREHSALYGLLNAVAPGGTFLFATHAADPTAEAELGFDPADFYQPADIAPLLGADWDVLINEIRPRTGPAPAGTHHTRDAVLRARRLR